MRQANWEDLFKGRELREEDSKPFFLTRFFSWEDLVTLIIVLIGFLTVVGSINGADWVREMPSLFPIAFLGLAVGLVLARAGTGEIAAHLTALAIGVVGIAYSSTSKIDGSLTFRMEQLADRMWLWGKAVYEGGISTDNLPFVVLVVTTTYLTAYLAAWSLFRWYNAWLALIPGGIALLTNISYLPGQQSAPLVIYLFCAILLLARLNLLRNARKWREENAGYPDFISLHVLNVTVWIAVLLLGIAWLLPVGSGSGAALSIWRGITSPIVEPLSDLGRVFAAIDSKQGAAVHNFGSTMPLQGAIALGNKEILVVDSSEPTLLRAQSYDEYISQGWRISPAARVTSNDWPALEALQSLEDTRRQLRRPLSLLVTVSDESNVIVTAGHPLAVNLDTKVVFGPDPADITSIRPVGRLHTGDQYRADSTVSNASPQRLQSAGTEYPDWIGPYLQLPSELPESIRDKAREVTASATNPYDAAVAIEQYLRTFGIDLRIDPAPPGEDSVEYFLFEARRGYFDYHASAMVVMLRTLDIPARLAVGYIIRPQDRNPNSNEYVVTERNSFAWPEVYFPGLGWVEFNPTPSEPTVARTGTDDRFIIPEDEFLFPEDELFPTSEIGPTGPATQVVDDLVIEEESSFISTVAVSIILAFLGVTVVTGGLVRFAWQYPVRNLDYASQIWEKTLRLSRWARIRSRPQETAREVADRLSRELPGIDDVDYLGESYIRSRYGRKDLAPDEKERLTSVWKQVRNKLLARALRWK